MGIRRGRDSIFVPGALRSNTSLLATVVGVATMVMLMWIPVVRRTILGTVVISIAATLLLYR